MLARMNGGRGTFNMSGMEQLLYDTRTLLDL